MNFFVNLFIELELVVIEGELDLVIFYFSCLWLSFEYCLLYCEEIGVFCGDCYLLFVEV